MNSGFCWAKCSRWISYGQTLNLPNSIPNFSLDHLYRFVEAVLPFDDERFDSVVKWLIHIFRNNCTIFANAWILQHQCLYVLIWRQQSITQALLNRMTLDFNICLLKDKADLIGFFCLPWNLKYELSEERFPTLRGNFLYKSRTTVHIQRRKRLSWLHLLTYLH